MEKINNSIEKKFFFIVVFAFNFVHFMFEL